MANEIHKSETPFKKHRQNRGALGAALIRKFIEKLQPGIADLYAGKTDFKDELMLRFLYRHAKTPGVTEDILFAEEPLLTELTEKTAPAFTEDGLIQSQRLLRGVPFGEKGNTADHGCGWVSYYNARMLTGRPIGPVEALKNVWRGRRKGGQKGTDPFYLVRLLRKDGYYAAMFFAENDAERVAKAADAVIVLYLYPKRSRLFGHFVAAKYDKEAGDFITCNGEGGNIRRVSAIKDIPSRNSFFRMVIAISRKGNV